MKKTIKLLNLLLLAGLLTSCLSSGVDIVVNKDGSGEIIQTFQIQKEYMAFMNQGETQTDPNMIDRQALANMAASMGEGVTLKKVEPADAASPYGGYKAYFVFSDISKVRTPSSPMTTPGELTDSSDWISFAFKKGGTSTLTVMTTGSDQMDDSDEMEMTEETTSEEDEGMKEQMKEIYKTMHFWVKIQVNGNISDTNALYSDQSEVIMMDMNFEKIVENDSLFSHLTASANADLEDVRDELEKVGVRIDDQEKI